jgi:hypothetical protein
MFDLDTIDRKIASKSFYFVSIRDYKVNIYYFNYFSFLPTAIIKHHSCGILNTVFF